MGLYLVDKVLVDALGKWNRFAIAQIAAALIGDELTFFAPFLLRIRVLTKVGQVGLFTAVEVQQFT